MAAQSDFILDDDPGAGRINVDRLLGSSSSTASYGQAPPQQEIEGRRQSDDGPDLERELIASTCSVHVRIALEDDDRLEVVPSSHERWDTDEELRIRRGSNRATDQMPHAIRVILKAGDACLFHAWSIHRATYRRAPIRRTLDLLFASTHPSKTQ